MEMAQVKSRQRVTDHGEVYTSAREVNAMLDLVKNETERIDSRFLEPACGHGNFLTAILTRKLDVVARTYGKSQVEYERYAVLAVGSIYGIDLLADNIVEARERLFEIFDARYRQHFKPNIKPQCLDAVKYILDKNIVVGNALNMRVGEDDRSEPIVFSEWSLINGNKIKRREFVFAELVVRIPEVGLFSDLGEQAYEDKPIREYPPVDFLTISYAYGDTI